MFTAHRTDASIRADLADEVDRFIDRIDNLTRELHNVGEAGRPRDLMVRRLRTSVAGHVDHLYNSREPRN